MALNKVVRMRVIMDLLKDGNVTTEANYADSSIDYLDVATALKYGEAFYSSYGPIYDGEGLPIAWADMNGEEKAGFLINKIRVHFRNVLLASRVPPAGDTARATESSTVKTEVESELGTDE